MKKQKKLEFCEKIIQMEFDGKKLECKNIFFTDETRIDTAPNTSGDVRTGWSILSYFKKKSKF